jgi:hypothetical protein
MGRTSEFTNGNFYVSTWIGTDDDYIDVINNYQSKRFQHFIEIESGATNARNVEVVGLLPESPPCMKFQCDESGLASHKWKRLIHLLTASHPERVYCSLNIVSNHPAPIRFQCAEVKYEDIWNAGNWCNCSQNIPITGVVRIK